MSDGKDSSSSKPGRTRVGGPLMLVALIVLLAGGGYVFYLYRTEGSVGGALKALRQTSAEAALSAKVKAALALSKRVSAFDVAVSTRQDVVTLSGRVSSPQVREIAASVARDVAGVREVRNEIALDPSVMPRQEVEALAQRIADLELRSAALEALRGSPTLEGAQIDVQAQRGVLSLTGAAATAAQREAAETLLRGLEGVRGITSEITAPDPPPTAEEDATVLARLAAKLEAAQVFAPGTIEVRVQRGAALLSGSVRSRAEKLLAEALAREVEGVREVVSSLEAPPPSPAPPPR